MQKVFAVMSYHNFVEVKVEGVYATRDLAIQAMQKMEQEYKEKHPNKLCLFFIRPYEVIEN